MWVAGLGKQTLNHFYTSMYLAGQVMPQQIWPESVYLPDRGTGFYDGLEPLNNEDVEETKKQIEIVLQEDKYGEER